VSYHRMATARGDPALRQPILLTPAPACWTAAVPGGVSNEANELMLSARQPLQWIADVASRSGGGAGAGSRRQCGLAGGGGLFLNSRRCGLEAAVMEGFERRGR